MRSCNFANSVNIVMGVSKRYRTRDLADFRAVFQDVSLELIFRQREDFGQKIEKLFCRFKINEYFCSVVLLNGILKNRCIL